MRRRRIASSPRSVTCSESERQNFEVQIYPPESFANAHLTNPDYEIKRVEDVDEAEAKRIIAEVGHLL